MIDSAPKNRLDVQDAELLNELQRSTPDAVRRERAHTRVTVRAKVVVQSGNMSQRRDLKVQGVSGDLSAGGCQLLVPVPIAVADIYWLTFDRSEIDIAPIYARCLRCREVRADAFEAGFAFFAPIDIAHLTSGSEQAEGPLV